MYDIAAGMLGTGQEEFLLRGRQDTYECYPASLYMPELPEGDVAYLRTYVDRSFTQGRGPLPIPLDRLALAKYSMIQIAGDAAKGGNINAAKNLMHWVAGNGIPMLDYDVERMIRDLPRWRADIAKELETRILELIKNDRREDPEIPCQIYITNTASDKSPYGGFTWRRVGIGPRASEMDPTRDIYTGGKGLSVDIQMMRGAIPPPNYMTNQEFDWYIAMNAFDYSLAIAVVWNRWTDDMSVCYRVDIADEYAWYFDAGKLDKVMAILETNYVGTWYPIRGHSKTRCLPILKVRYELRKEVQQLPFDFSGSLASSGDIP